jgi:hypothetical protein
MKVYIAIVTYKDRKEIIGVFKSQRSADSYVKGSYPEYKQMSTTKTYWKDGRIGSKIFINVEAHEVKDCDYIVAPDTSYRDN